jgi:hypothetical protein
MKVVLNTLNDVKGNENEVLLLKVNCDNINSTDKASGCWTVEQKLPADEETLIEENKKNGEWVILHSAQNRNLAPQPNNNNNFEIFCCNLTACDKTEHSILLHVDYWRKQIIKINSQS